MLCDPKEGSAVALKHSIVVSLEVRQDLYSLIAADIRTGSGAVRNAEPKHNFVRLALEHVIRQVIKDRYGTHRSGSTTADPINCRASNTVVELWHQKIKVIAPCLQNLIIFRVGP